MIELVATDIDGTLLNSRGEVSPRNRAALDAAAEAGLLVAFVTGRPPRWLDDLIEATGHTGVAVGANGAVIWDMAREEMISSHCLDPDDLRDLAQSLREAFPRVAFAIEFGLSFAAEPSYVHDWEISPRFDRRGVRIPPPRIGSLDEIVDQPAVKLLVKDRTVDPDTFLAEATKVIGERATLTHSSSFGLLELSAPGITKATGLADLTRRLGVTAEQVAAIGDMPNDLPMLEWAGTSYAVGNAHPEVKAAADQVTVTNDEDAVALLIESILATR